MSLQELIKGKWVTLKVSKPISSGNFAKFPNTFSFTLKNVQVGIKTYRLFISAKGKFSAFTGKAFTQVVKP